MQMKVEDGVEPGIGDVFIWAKRAVISPNQITMWRNLFSRNGICCSLRGVTFPLGIRDLQNVWGDEKESKRRRIGPDANEHLEEEEEVHMTVDPKAEA